MADTFNIDALFSGTRTYSANLTVTSDATNGTQTLVDVSSLTLRDGSAPSYCSILEAKWNFSGGKGSLKFDATTDDVAVVMSNDGYINFEDEGGLVDPQSTGSTGDILFVPVGMSSGDTANISIRVKLHA